MAMQMAVVLGGKVVGTVAIDRARDVFVADAVLDDGATVRRRAAKVSAARANVARGIETGRDWRVAGEVAGTPVLVEMGD